MLVKGFLRTTLIMLALISNAYALTTVDLVDKDWILQKLQGIKVSHELYQGKKPMLKFNAELKFSAWAGCNQINGSYTLTGNDTLVFDKNIVMTKMACAGPQNIEEEFVAMLQTVHMVAINGQVMQFMTESHKVVAEFAQLQS